MANLCAVALSDAERLLFQQIITKGKASARTTTRARILLKAGTGPEGPEWMDTKIAEAVEVSRPTIERLRKRGVTEGVGTALRDRPKWENRHGKLDGEQGARLTALACSTPPAGRSRWTLHLLANYFGDREGVPVSYELARRVLKKTVCRLISRSSGASPRAKTLSGGADGLVVRQRCILPREDAKFWRHMEDVLDVYVRPYDPNRPQICLDERPTQLLADVWNPLPPRPGTSEQLGTPAREDYEYERTGIVNFFLSYEPLQSKRHVRVTEHRKRDDWAHFIKDVIYVHYPDAERIVLVRDNLNIHSPASLYVAFEAKDAKLLAEKLEIHRTPKHGSWLNVAEIELAILSSQCMDRRLPDIDILHTEITAWEETRNQTTTRVNWRFTAEDARINLKHLYPSHQS